MNTLRTVLLILLLGVVAAQGDETTLRLYWKEGVAAFQRGDYKTGREFLQKALELDPNHPITLVNLGSLEYRDGQLEEAEKHLRKATRVAPESFAAWMTLGVVAYEARKDDLALAALAQAVLLEPSNAQAHAYLGVTLGRKGWLDGAEASLARAVQLDETSRDAHFNLAVILLQRNPPSVELARKHYLRARELGAESDSLIEKQLELSKEKRK